MNDEKYTLIKKVFMKLKKEDRNRDFMMFLKESQTCGLEEVKELADWYLNKPKVMQ